MTLDRGYVECFGGIARLPFPVPSDPIFSARSELYDDGFGEYAVPSAVLRFRQGFGRLIRKKDDYGIIAVLDSRVLSKQYGKFFLSSIPECCVTNELEDVRAFLDRPRA